MDVYRSRESRESLWDIDQVLANIEHHLGTAPAQPVAAKSGPAGLRRAVGPVLRAGKEIPEAASAPVRQLAEDLDLNKSDQQAAEAVTPIAGLTAFLREELPRRWIAD